MEIVTLGHEVLRQKALPVADFNAELTQTISAMFEAMNTARGIGLAAPQIALAQRFFIVQLPDDQPRVFINPEVLATSHDLTPYEEGCLSIPGLWADVRRPAAVEIQAWNEKGKPFRIEAGGMLARVIQHELDHLDGVLFIDRIPEKKRERMMAEYSRKFRA